MSTDAAMFDVPSCGRCGSDCDWSDCEHCGGEGLDGHDCGEDCCACLFPEENRQCDICRGAGGWWTCCASGEWCEANPIADRAAIRRTC